MNSTLGLLVSHVILRPFNITTSLFQNELNPDSVMPIGLKIEQLRLVVGV